MDRKEVIVKEVYDKEKVKEIAKSFNIGTGESETIALWFQEMDSTVVIDDHKGINVCKIYAVPFVTALTLVIIAKQRNGPLGEIDLIFLKECARFENLEPEAD